MTVSPLPTFQLLDDQGETVTEKSLLGRWTVLYAYPKDNTPGCTQEACDFRDNWARVQALGAQVYGISKDSVKSHQGFIAKRHSFRSACSPIPTWCCSRASAPTAGRSCTARRWEAGRIRSTFLVDPAGVLRRTWPKVSVKGHVQQVLEALEALR